MALEISRNRSRASIKFTGVFLALFGLFIQPLIALNIPSAFAVGGAVSIANVSQLCDAINNQADGQTWTIQPGTYGLGVCNSIPAGGQTGWYFPVVANNVTINGVGNPTIYGTGYTTNGNWTTQNFVSVFGNNVTIDGLTLMPKVEPNKTIEVLGSDFTLKNTVISPNTLVDQTEYDNIPDPQDRLDEKQWGGSVYFSHAGNHTLQNVTINNAGVAFRNSPTGTKITFNNVKVVNTSNVDWINGYRYSTAFNQAGNYTVGLPSVVYHVNSSLNNLASVLAKVQDGDTIELDSDLTITEQLTLKKAVTLNGNNHILSPNFAKTDTANNSALGIQASGVTVNDLVEDGVNGINLHGMNVFNASGVSINNVTVKNNDYTGLVVNGSKVVVDNLTTATNGWGGADVDKAGAELTVNGTSHHDETLADIYVDNSAVGKVVDTNNQYGSKDNAVRPGDRVYKLKLTTPTLVFPTNNGYTTSNDFYFDWEDVSGAVSYEFQNSKVDTTNNGVLTSVNYAATSAVSKLHSTGAQDGTVRYWQVRAVDTNGIKSDWSEVWKMTIDMTTPAAPSELSWKTSTNVTVADNGITNLRDGTASWKANTSSDFDHYVYNYWNDISGNQWKESHPYSFTTTSANAAGSFTEGDGVHHFCVAAVDKAGNTSACTKFTITYDATAPEVSITSPAAGLVAGTVTISGTVNDANPSHFYFVVKNSSGSVVARTNQNGSTNGTVYASSPTSWTWNTKNVSNGTYTIVLEARDKAGNKSAKDSVKTLKVTVDNTDPTGTVAVTGDGARAVATLTVSEPIQTPTDWTRVNDQTFTREYTVNGSYTVDFFDLAGNPGSAGFSVTTIDTTAPILTMLTPTRNVDGTYTLRGTTEPGATVSLTIDGTMLSPTNPITGRSDGTWAYTTSVLAAGPHTITSTAKDGYNNVTNPGKTISFTTPATDENQQPTDSRLNQTGTPIATLASPLTGTPVTNGLVAVDAASNDQDNGEASVLGTTDTKNSTAGDTDGAAIATSDRGWKLWGITWYWWLLALLVIAGLWWFLAARRRRNQDE